MNTDVLVGSATWQRTERLCWVAW